MKAVETTSTITAQAEGQVGTKNGGVEGKLVIKNSGAKILDSGAMADALRGDYSKALDEAAGASQVEVSVTKYDRYGVSASPQLKAFGFGGTLDFESLRTDKADAPMVSYKGSAKDAGAALMSWNDQQQQSASMNQLLARGEYPLVAGASLHMGKDVRPALQWEQPRQEIAQRGLVRTLGHLGGF